VKVVKKLKNKPTLSNDLRASLDELARWARGEETGAIVRLVIPSAAKAQRAREKLRLIKREPNAVRRALKKRKAS
jgi:hypothetical protein